jgi:hypothetical protein
LCTCRAQCPVDVRVSPDASSVMAPCPVCCVPLHRRHAYTRVVAGGGTTFVSVPYEKLVNAALSSDAGAVADRFVLETHTAVHVIVGQ